MAPPIELTEPNFTIPEIRSCSTGPSTWTPMSLPTFRSFLSAVDWSTTTSSFPGQPPSTSVSVLNCGFVGSTEKPRFGAPPKAIALPFLMSCAFSLETPPIAFWTSGSSCTFASSDSSKEASVDPLSLVSNADFAVIVASVLR